MRFPTQTGGFTLVELLIGMSLLIAVMTIAFMLFQSSNKLIETDAGRVNAMQNTQTALDIMTNDLRQAGENLTTSGPNISGIQFDSSAQTLTIRRGIAPMTASQVGNATDMITRRPEVLSICNIAGNRIQIIGAKDAALTSTTNCTYNPRPDGDDAKAYTWRVYFASQNSQPQAALLYRPGTAGTTEAYAPVNIRTVSQVEPSLSSAVNLRKIWLEVIGNIPAGFTDQNGSQVILIDQRRYWVQDNQLKLAVAGQTDDQAETVAFDVRTLTLSANLLSPAATVTSLAINGPWKRVQSVTTTLASGSSGQGRTLTRSFQSTVYPRNVSSERRR
ncbi:PilW family protein [Deinococcus kurensis]|uniref:PilW family protein n=1 Tax=Deinococcus kurensis TaxID=2662757 RepID=UPI0012D2B6DE|nr:hypothetical protein [Deinococcus kurensis]